MQVSMTTTNQKNLSFGLTWPQRIGYISVPFVVAIIMVFFGQSVTGVAGILLTILLGLGLGVITFFISASFVFGLTFSPQGLRITDRNQKMTIPTDKIGMLVKNGGKPFPMLWLVLKNTTQGKPIPEKGVDQQTRDLIEAYGRRNPGKSFTIVKIQGGYLRSIPEFARELKRRLPPVIVDERLLK